MNKISKTLGALLLLGSLSGTAQTFSWGSALPSLDENNNPSIHLLSGSFFRIYSKYNTDLFNRDVKITPFTAGTLKPGTLTDISVEQPVMGRAMMTHLKMFPVNGTTQVIFLDEFNTKTKQRELFYQTVDLATGTKTTPVVITAAPGRDADYTIEQSPNGQYYGVWKYHSHEKKQPEKLNFLLLDKDFKIVKETTFITPYANKQPSVQQFYVSDAGTVFIVKELDLPKQKPFKTVFFWDGKSDTMKETVLKFENDYQIHQYNGLFSGGDFYFDALYTRIGSKAVQAYGGNKPAAGFYMAKFNAQGNKVYITANDTGEIFSLNLREFVMDGNKTWLFADKLFVADKYKTINGKPSFEKDYTFHNDGLLVARLDNETGKLEWHKELKLEDQKTLNDNGAYVSYLYFLKDGGVALLYNSTQPVKFGKIEATDRFIICETYDGAGNQTGKTTLQSTGLEKEYNYTYKHFEEDFDLDTSVKPVKVNDNTYIVRAKSNSNEKYGYLKF